MTEEQRLEIDREKLAFEREKFSQLHRLERWKAFWISGVVGVVVVLIGTIAAIYSAFLESIDREQELRLRSLEIEQDYLTRFEQMALSENIQKRLDFAKFVSRVAQDEPLRQRWLQYFEEIEQAHREEAENAIRYMIRLRYENDTNEGLNFDADVERERIEDCLKVFMPMIDQPGSNSFVERVDSAFRRCDRVTTR